MTHDGLRVLVADDAPEIRYVITRVLEVDAPNWHVIAQAANGQEAIEQARAEQPDLVLLDISMPVLDGLEALPLIRGVAPRAVVIVVSGFASTTAAAHARDAGAVAYIEKDDLVASLVPQIESAITAMAPV